MNAEGVPTFVVGVPLFQTSADRALATLMSILNQRGIGREFNVRVRVIVRDPDDELDKCLTDLAKRGIEVEADCGKGLYRAVEQALSGQTADFFSYLGGGDVLEPNAMQLVLEASSSLSTYAPVWVTGMIRGRREDGAIVRSLLPFRYTRRNFDNGIHGSILPTVQQESTFWSGALNDAVDWAAVSRLSLAGDYMLWKQFLRFCEPIILEAAIGSFTWHGDNRSSDWDTYQREVRSITREASWPERISAHLERAAWGLPVTVKARLSRQIRRYKWPNGPWV